MNVFKALILVIEDDPAIRRFLNIALTGQQYRVQEAPTAEAGLRAFGLLPPDLVILDLGLPDREGIQALGDLRRLSKVPILIVSARGHERGKIDALDAGADDYLTKPFGVGELLARVRVALRRAAATAQPNSPKLSIGDIHVNQDARAVTVGGKPVRLTPHEYRLLMVLMRNAGKVMTHQQLLKAVWGTAHVFETHYVRVYMNQLRKKLEPNPSEPRYIMTETGVGYRLNLPEES